MSGRGVLFQRNFYWCALALATAMALTATAGDATARSHRIRHHHDQADAETYEPASASIVVDANSGAVMEQANADSLRHPASLTKIMTLYLLFEQLEAGKLKLSSELPVSVHASEQAPTKLGLRPGDTIKVDSAIRAIVTKSANDIAVVVAEAIGGDETSFGKMMTAKAHALGMAHTNYHNASGLPDDLQITTARDQSILARAIQDRFPQYYHYFATESFEFHGVVMRNHNHLLGRIPGVDGMKTGYIRASGFNIVTSVHRGNRRIIAVVFGGRTAGARDARVVSLIENNINVASTKRTAPLVVENGKRIAPLRPENETVVQAQQQNKKAPERTVASIVPTPMPDPRFRGIPAATVASDDPAAGSTAPIEPTPVKTVIVRMASAPQAPLASPISESGSAKDSVAASPTLTVPPAVTEVAAIDHAPSTSSPAPSAAIAQASEPAPIPSEPATVSSEPVSATKIAPATESISATSSVTSSIKNSVTSSIPEPAIKPRSGWVIQIGAFDDEKEAQQHLASAKLKAKALLGKADPFTERISKGEKALYRARFAGLDKEQAETACKHLKRSDIPCMMLKN